MSANIARRTIVHALFLSAILSACASQAPPAEPGVTSGPPFDQGAQMQLANVTPTAGLSIDGATPTAAPRLRFAQDLRPTEPPATLSIPVTPTPTLAPLPPDLAPVVDPVVADAMDELGLVGVTVGVQIGSEPPFIKAYGHDAAPEGLYVIASVTKQFTAAAVLQLAEAEKLSLDDPIGRYFAYAPPDWADITVRHLLNHTSGLPELDATALASLDVNHEHTVDEVVALIQDESVVPTFTPGSSFAYINAGYYLLGAIIERASGSTYGQYLDQHIFQPLDLTSSGFDMAYPQNLAQGYSAVDGDLVPVQPVHPSLTYAAGGVVSTARDLLAWQRALAQGGRVVTPQAYQAMTARTALNSGGEAAYGYGLWVGHPACAEAVHHGGRIQGFASHLLNCAVDDVGFVVLLNSNPADPVAAQSLITRLAWVVLNPPP
jgi:CubicO group peptidase (beta-lactamase class C family)